MSRTWTVDKTRPHYLYVMSGRTGLVKIGYTSDLSRRVQGLRRQAGDAQLRLEDSAEVPGAEAQRREAYAHHLAREHHVGREMFAVSVAAASAIIRRAASVQFAQIAEVAPLDGLNRGRKRRGEQPGTIRSIRVDPALWERLVAIAHRRGVTTNAALVDMLEEQIKRHEALTP